MIQGEGLDEVGGPLVGVHSTSKGTTLLIELVIKFGFLTLPPPLGIVRLKGVLVLPNEVGVAPGVSKTRYLSRTLPSLRRVLTLEECSGFPLFY